MARTPENPGPTRRCGAVEYLDEFIVPLVTRPSPACPGSWLPCHHRGLCL